MLISLTDLLIATRFAPKAGLNPRSKKDGGKTMIVSSFKLYNKLAESRPYLLQELDQPWVFFRFGESTEVLISRARCRPHTALLTLTRMIQHGVARVSPQALGLHLRPKQGRENGSREEKW